MSNKFFSERLRALRGHRKKAEFARLLGLSAPAYQRYEEGRIPRSDCLSVIAERCNVSVDWLLGQGSTTANPAPVSIPAAAPVSGPDPPPCPGCVAKDSEIAYLKEVVSDQAQSLRDQAATIRALSAGVCRYPTSDAPSSTPSSKAG